MSESLPKSTSDPQPGIPRWLEVLVSAGVLLLLSPVCALVALLLWVSSPGPILFRQERVGRRGRRFFMVKFRSMRPEARGPQVTARDDARVTAAGRLIRGTKIDEVPELWNVLRGDMALVGPRPEVARYVEPTDPRWTYVLSARPGITDPVTLALRNEEDLLAAVPDRETFYREVLLPYKLDASVTYLKRRTLWSDLGVLARTVVAVVVPSTVPPPHADALREHRSQDSPLRPPPPTV